MKRLITLVLAAPLLTSCVTYTMQDESQPKPQKSSKVQKHRDAEEVSDTEDSNEATNRAAINGAVDVLNNAIFWGSTMKR